MLHAYYERPELWDRAIYTSGYERERMTAAVAAVPTGVSSLLDVGCGNGAFLSYLEAMRPEIRACGVEPSQRAVGSKWCTTPIISAEMIALPFADQSFDIVASMAVLEHIPTDQAVRGIQELSRVARQFILIDLPYREHRARIRCPDCGCGFDPHLHLRTYGDREISNLFTGFNVAARRILRGTEALIPYVVLRLMRLELSAARFPNAVCPQCGRHSTAANSTVNSAASPKKTLLRRGWDLQPKLSVPREILVLFKRA